MRLSNELQVGKAGEYLVCADLIMKGFVAFPSEQGLPYDVLLDNGSRLVRVQVKTCAKPRVCPQRAKKTLFYQYNVKRHGKNNKAKYGEDEVDVFALVALDSRQVGYIRACDLKTTMNYRVDALRGTYYDEKGIKDYQKVCELKRENPKRTQTSIAKELGLAVAVVNRMLMPGYAPYITSSKYLSDISRDANWFINL